MVFASAGHLFPYRVTPDGKVEALESIAYACEVQTVPKTSSSSLLPLKTSARWPA